MKDYKCTKCGAKVSRHTCITCIKCKDYKEIGLKISESSKGKIFSEEHKKNLSLSHKHYIFTEKHKESLRKAKIGKHPPNYIFDRTKLARISKQGERRTSIYREWRKQVWLRDKFKCKIDNPDCKGKIEAHHILGWSSHPELRFNINNGITLCHAHHPRKRAEEKRLVPTFQELVLMSVSK